MKKTFIKTKNVKRFVALMDELQKLPPNIPKLALVYGDHGLGKTKTIIWWATRNDAVYVRANNEISQNGLLQAVAEELGERPLYFMQDNFKLILKHLRQEPKIIVVDEADYLFNGKNAIEILRDIQDLTGCPIVLSGMGAMDKRLAKFKHFEDRLYKKLKFEQFSSLDIKEIVNEITELRFTEDAIEYLATRTNQFRQLVKLINKIEILSETNKFDEIDEYTLKAIINERQILTKTEPNKVSRLIYAENQTEYRFAGGKL